MIAFSSTSVYDSVSKGFGVSFNFTLSKGTQGKVMDNNYLAAYVAVYEYRGALFGGYSRQFMRHSSIVVDRGNGSFDCFHVTGTPGIGLTYSCVQQWGYPRTIMAILLSMDFAGWIR